MAVAIEMVERPRQPWRAWTTADVAVLRAHYVAEGVTATARRLGRSRASVAQYAFIHGMWTARRWTPSDSQTLRAAWHEVSQKALRALFPRRTWLAIRQHALVLGLSSGVPQGYEALGHAAKRLGYGRGTLARILAAAGVAVFRAYAYERRRGVGRVCYAEPDAMEEAASAHETTETIFGAARARGIPNPTLWRVLRRAGVVVGKHRQGQPYRIPSTAIDAAVAAWRARRT